MSNRAQGIVYGLIASLFIVTMIEAGTTRHRIGALEALHENEKGASTAGPADSGLPAGARSGAAPALTGEPRRGYTSTHDFMLDTFPDVEQHNHGRTACTYHLGGYRFTFKWDGERWEQVEAVRED